MSNKNIYEIFEDFKKETTRAGRLAVLQKNNTKVLKDVLQGTYHPDVTFFIKKIPEYKNEPVPPGMAYGNMTEALSRIYLFVANNPRTPAGLTEKRKTEILIQILESLEPQEAEVFANIIRKDQKIPFLTNNLINEAFPGLLPEA